MNNMEEEVYDVPQIPVDQYINEPQSSASIPSNVNDVRVTVVDAKCKSNPVIASLTSLGSQTILNNVNPALFHWIGILMIIGAGFVFIFELLAIFSSCYFYGSVSYYVGTWVSWIVLVSGILQLRLSIHFDKVSNLYVMITVVSVWFSFVTLLIGFILALIFRFNYQGPLCAGAGVLLVSCISINFVSVIFSLVVFFTHFSKRR